VASSKITIGAHRGSSARTRNRNWLSWSRRQIILRSKSNSHDLPSAKDEPAFSEVVRLIAASRERAIRDLNTVLIDLYWRVGEIISRQIEAAEWGDGSHLATV
jgi:hypothetical protein